MADTPVYGFTDKALITQLYGQLGLDNILADLTAPNDGYAINAAIRDAEETIMIRLNRFFNPTDMVGNYWVQSRCTWLACYYLASRRGNEHYFQARYEEAIRELDAIATGELPPPIDINLRDHTYPSMSNFVIDENFAVNKIRVRPTISVGGTYSGQDIGFGYVWGWV